MAGDDMRTIVKTFSDGPMFMQDHVDPRTKAKHDRIAASPEAQDRIARGLPADYADRVARAIKGSN
jgi:hypothetical protein